MVFSISFNKILKHINLPLLSSIGIHGLFFALILPQWNPRGELSSNNGLQNTPVIELNQLEQSRIPSQNPDNTFNWNILNSLPEDANQNLAFNIPNNSLPEVQIAPLPFPSINNNSAINNLPSLPPLPPPTSFYSSNPSTLPLPNYQIDTSASTQLPPPPNIEESLNQEIITSLPVLPEDSDLPTSNQQITTNIEISPEQEAEIRQRLFGNSPIEITANPRDVINDRNTSIDDANENNTSNKQAIVNPLPKNHQSLTTQLQKNTENTSDEEARKNYVTWANEVKTVQAKQITLQGIYPKDACIRQLEGTTTYGVTVNQQGSVVNSKLIKSSGYNIFNNQALTQIQNYNFANNTGQNQPYHVYVNFKYDNKVCPSLSVNNLGKTSAPKSTNQAISPSPKVNNSSTETSSNINNATEKTETSVKKSQSNSNQETVNNPSNINLPNTSENKANTLVIPTNPSESVKSPETQPQSLSPKSTEKDIDESSEQKSTTENSPEIKLVK